MLLGRSSISSNDGRNDSCGVAVLAGARGRFSRRDAAVAIAGGWCHVRRSRGGPVEGGGGGLEATSETPRSPRSIGTYDADDLVIGS